MEYQFSTSVQYLKGVGPQLGLKLAHWEIKTLEDLVQFLPRTYQHWRKVLTLKDVKPGDYILLPAVLTNMRSYRRGPQRVFELLFEDRDKQKFVARFFRQPFYGYFERFRYPQNMFILGRATLSSRGTLEFHHPELKLPEDISDFSDQLVPIYSETKGLSSRKIHKLIEQTFQLLGEKPQLWKAREYLPDWLRKQFNLTSLQESLKLLHFPSLELEKQFLLRRTEGHRRLIFEEFFWMELAIRKKKQQNLQDLAQSYPGTGREQKLLRGKIPFQLTSSQDQSIKEISHDLATPIPMNRLLQGDVGSGKTIVIFFAALQIIESQGQVAMMVPTEILAEQHFRQAQSLLEPLGIKSALLTSKTKSEERKKILKDLLSGQVHFLIGTHALIQEDVQFAKLGLVVIDEQHRFGVQQRFKLQAKGESPHRLLVTATPIPRTLAMTVYGDLEVSILREKPPGRSPIQSKIMTESQRPLFMDFLLKQIQQGRQAYFVYPLVEESEKMDLKSAVESFEQLQLKYPSVRWGLLHGKMKAVEKEAIMHFFREGKIQVLVSTTVIEVGVDVPNAVVMVIEHAERFGLSQLHQLRGRVGRGSLKSYCVFSLGEQVSEDARKRLQLMCETEDGFKIAEADLEWRGAGEFLGLKQSGEGGFRWANLVKDEEILLQARTAVNELYQRDPQLQMEEHQLLKERWLRKNWSQTS